MTEVRLQNVRVVYAGQDVVRDVSFTVGSGELVVLVGPSGSGKTTLLRAITGYAPVVQGSVAIGGRDVTHLPPAGRDIAMVFQNLALYPHMTVAENWRFPLQAVKLAKAEQDARIAHVARTLQMTRLLNRYPRQLSGGQQQRVAMGRALVRQPQIFLLDEPLGALDAKLRVEARTAFKTLQRDLGITTLYVTHDQVEAQALGSRIIVLNDGVVQQVGTPDELYDAPINRFVAGLFGSPPMNFFQAELRHEAGQTTIGRGALRLTVPSALRPRLEDGETARAVTLGVRPEAIRIRLDPTPTAVPAQVYVVEPRGHNVIVDLRLGDDVVRARADRDDERVADLAPDSPVAVEVDPTQIHLFDAATGVRLT